MKFASFRLRYIAVACLLFSLIIAGCGKSDEPKGDVPSRTQDPVYKARLKELVGEQKKIAVRRNQILASMEKVKSLARKALPEGVADAIVVAEIEKNSSKYPSWKSLKEQFKAVEQEYKTATIKARAEIATRIKRDLPNDNNSRGKGTVK